MKEIRLCDNTDFITVSNLCKTWHLGIEMQTFSNPYIDNMHEILKEHKEVLEDLSGGKSLHAPFWDLNLGTKMKELRKETLETFQYAYNLGKNLGCTEIVVHNGYIPGSYEYNGWINRAVQFWEEFFIGKDDSITMCIENQFEVDSEIMKLEVDAVNDKRLKICLDVGHAHANSNWTAGEWISTLGDRIAYFHLHNNHGRRNIKGKNNDEHLGFTHGTINMKYILDIAECCCPDAIWNIETSVMYLEESIAFLKENNYL